MTPEEWDDTPWYLQRAYLDGLLEDGTIGGDQQQQHRRPGPVMPPPQQRPAIPEPRKVDAASLPFWMKKAADDV